MTLEQIKELVESAKAKKAVAEEVTNAEQTVDNIKTKVVDDTKPAEGITHTEDNKAGDAAEVAKEVEAAVDPVVDADKDGVSKNGGEDDHMEAGKIEADRKKEDNKMKDVINVTGRTYEESVAVEQELKAQLESSSKEVAALKEQIAKVNKVVKAALEVQQERYTEAVAERVTKLLNQIREEGLAIEESLVKEAEAAKKNCAKAESFAKTSLRLSNILREGLLSMKAPKKFVTFESSTRKMLKDLNA